MSDMGEELENLDRVMHKCTARIQELEAHCAAMRASLLIARDHCHDLDPELWEEALATDAGKVMLERLEEAAQVKADGPWLACDQTVQCWACGWVDWPTENGVTPPHPADCWVTHPAMLRERAEKAERIVDFDRHVALDANRREALTEMRERCAKVAEDLYDPGQQPDRDIGHDVAAAIRALKLEDM